MKVFNFYTEKDIKNDIIDLVLNDCEVWDYSIEELDYLIATSENKNWLLKDSRLYELDNYINNIVKSIKK